MRKPEWMIDYDCFRCEYRGYFMDVAQAGAREWKWEVRSSRGALSSNG